MSYASFVISSSHTYKLLEEFITLLNILLADSYKYLGHVIYPSQKIRRSIFLWFGRPSGPRPPKC